jgi:hypothetical protein
MIVAKLTISYDRGLAFNDARDIAADGSKKDIFTRGAKTPDGKIIRGLGTHYRSEADALLVQERDKEARRIYNEFRSRFISTTIDGLYVVPQRGVAKAYVQSLEVRPDMKVRVTEFELSTHEPLASAEVNEWAQRIKRQLGSISLGRSKEADAEGPARSRNAVHLPGHLPVHRADDPRSRGDGPREQARPRGAEAQDRHAGRGDRAGVSQPSPLAGRRGSVRPRLQAWEVPRRGLPLEQGGGVG